MTYPGWRWDGKQWQRVPVKKKRTGLVVTLALLIPGLVILLCVGGLVAVISSDTDNGSQVNTDDQADEETPTTQGRDGHFEFSVLEVERGVDPKDEFWSEEPQGEYVAVTLRVENIGDEPRELDSAEQRLYDTDDREYRAAGGIGEWEYETVNPGNSIEVDIYYDVPPKVELVRMELHDSVWSGGVDVGLPG